ncbi:nucleoside diphosphate kinase 6 [Grus japonensis]|uniref:Nucleoside diphosphate kinase 6 n=1 Tax=Grus japonensis TaxID=30415 RepID=A0ABC9WZF5_GRUJA
MVFTQELVGIIDRALGLEEEGDIRLAFDKLWDDMPRLDGQGVSEGPQPVAWRHAGYTAAHLKSYGDEPGASEVIEESMRRGGMLDLILTNKEGLVGNVKLKGSLGCSEHEMVEFKILRAARRAHSKLSTLDFRRADFGIFRDLLG